MLVGNTRFDRFIADITAVVEGAAGNEPFILCEGARLLSALVSDPQWYPEELAQADDQRFRQNMLHRSPDGGLSVLGVVWGPGQSAPPHDHTTWGLIGQLRGAEATRRYVRTENGLRACDELVLRPGETVALSPLIGDIHDVRNVDPGVSISIHVYGGDLEALAHRRSRYDAETGTAIAFQADYH